MRDIKLRAWDKINKKFYYPDLFGSGMPSNWRDFYEITQFTGIKDKNGNDIYFDDVLRFADKWEWYKVEYAIKMMFADSDRSKAIQEQYDAEPYEQRVVESIEDYEWLLSGEIQQYWEIIGNIHENSYLLK